MLIKSACHLGFLLFFFFFCLASFGLLGVTFVLASAKGSMVECDRIFPPECNPFSFLGQFPTLEVSCRASALNRFESADPNLTRMRRMSRRMGRIRERSESSGVLPAMLFHCLVRMSASVGTIDAFVI